MTLIIIIAIVVLLVVWYFATYNSLVSLRNRKDDQFAQIDVQLKRRADLIPNLVETVKGYAKHEKDTLEEVVKARNTYLSAKTPEEQIKADNALEGTLTKLFALSESYPELKSSENYKTLQQSIADVEEHLQAARRMYNANVSSYNQMLVAFPSSMIASMKGLKKRDFFEAEETKKEDVKIDL